MIFDKDLIGLLENIYIIEKKMENTYIELAKKLTIDEYKKIFLKMAKDESDHEKKVEELKKILI